jgi:DNA-directed RNA polymerase subunit RPC12/RpoP
METPTYTCRKCGEELILDDIESWDELACPGCSEPIPEECVPRSLNCKKPGPHGGRVMPCRGEG